MRTVYAFFFFRDGAKYWAPQRFVGGLKVLQGEGGSSVITWAL